MAIFRLKRGAAAGLPSSLSRLAGCAPEDRLDALVALVDTIRPRRTHNAKAINDTFRDMAITLRSNPQACEGLRAALVWLLADTKAIHLYTDAGVLANEGFLTALSRRISNRLLPEEIDRDRLKDAVGLIFHRPLDDRWISQVDEEIWLDLLVVLRFHDLSKTPEALRIQRQLLNALEVVSYRITAIGLEPEFVRVYPVIERYESPFLRQNAEMRLLFDQWQATAQTAPPTSDDAAPLLVLVDQCDELLVRIRKGSEHTAASVGLTYLLVRASQNLLRLRRLIGVLYGKSARERVEQGLALLREVIIGENRKNSVRDLIQMNIGLLATRITSNAGRAGEQYITSNRREYFKLLRSAMGAGLIVAIMAAVKIWLGQDHHAPFVQATLYSMNYVGGFVLMYVLHFSLATKQPAMTANRIAHSVDAENDHKIESLADLVVRTARSQFVAVLGNIIVAVPVALLIARFTSLGAQPFPDPERAQQLLAQAAPLRALTWLQAMLTGVALFMTGLVSGYYDNKAIYARIGPRLQQLALLRRLLGPRGAAAVSAYVEAHLGGIAGCVFFGVVLGSTAAIGIVLGLPLDTLHVTFVSANCAYAWHSLPNSITISRLIDSIAAVAIIGLLNLATSFGIALYVALRSRETRSGYARPLIRQLGRRAWYAPLDFLFPPRDQPPEADPEATLKLAIE
jgi:site-specific recombinase